MHVIVFRQLQIMVSTSLLSSVLQKFSSSLITSPHGNPSRTYMNVITVTVILTLACRMKQLWGQLRMLVSSAIHKLGLTVQE